MPVKSKTTWFDLPREIRQMICGMLNPETIIYVPKDRRMKVDPTYNQAHHFHSLMLVSKQFITPDDFAYAVLSTSVLKIGSYNELRKITTRVRQDFKERITQVELDRSGMFYNGSQSFGRDPFQDFSAIPRTLSTHFPQLKKITVTMNDWCGYIGNLVDSTPNSPQESDSSRTARLLQQIFSSQRSYRSQVQNNAPAKIADIATGFIGERDRRQRAAIFRPQSWLRRLILASEDTGLEVLFIFDLCIAFHDNLDYVYTIESHIGGHDLYDSSPCFSTRALRPRYITVTDNGVRYRAYDGETWLARCSHCHIPAEMSTKDWILRTKFDGQKFESHQQTAYNIVHLDQRKQSHEWARMLQRLAYQRF